MSRVLLRTSIIVMRGTLSKRSCSGASFSILSWESSCVSECQYLRFCLKACRNDLLEPSCKKITLRKLEEDVCK